MINVSYNNFHHTVHRKHILEPIFLELQLWNRRALMLLWIMAASAHALSAWRFSIDFCENDHDKQGKLVTKPVGTPMK